MIQRFETKNQLEQILAHEIAEKLKAAIELFGDARMLLSGGSTPALMYEELSTYNLDWSKVIVGLVDERFVALDSTFSNESLLRKHLLQHQAVHASMIGMVADLTSYEQNAQLIDDRYSLFKDRTDVVVLGMGEDGHTASLFPGDPASELLLTSDAIGVFNTTAPATPTQRITCSKELLFHSHHVYLMVTGSKKMTVLQRAKDDNYPISVFLSYLRRLQIYYSEN